jgi:sugar lactone lactonase YvrE
VTFNEALGVAVAPNGDVLVADGNAVRRVTPQGVVTTVAGAAIGLWSGGLSLGADAAGSLYVLDRMGGRVVKLSADVPPVASTLAGGGSDYADGLGADAGFNQPTGLAVGADGTVYVADFVNNVVRRVTPAGLVTTIAGNTGAALQDGKGPGARFNGPAAVAIDPLATPTTLYVTDHSNHALRRLVLGSDGQATVMTVAGGPDKGNADGPGANARFHFPSGVAIGADGTVYVADTGNQRIRKVVHPDTSPVVSTVAGSVAGFFDGAGADALFNEPNGVAIGADGKLYVADQANYRIRVITP